MMSKMIIALVFGAVLVASQVSCSKNVGLDQDMVKTLAQEYQAAQAASETKWVSYGESVHVYMYNGGGKPTEKIAGYGVQSTIVQTRSGSVFPTSADDWQLIDGIKEELEQASNGARVVMFDNQLGVFLGKVSLEDVKKRTEHFIEAIGVPCTVIIATRNDRFRKPRPGMLHLFEQAFNGNVQVDLTKSYYKAYASGGSRYADTDLKFASAIGFKFRESPEPAKPQ